MGCRRDNEPGFFFFAGDDRECASAASPVLLCDFFFSFVCLFVCLSASRSSVPEVAGNEEVNICCAEARR